MVTRCARHPAPSSSFGSDGLEILEVDAAFGRMAALEGAGSTTERGRLFRALLSPRYPGGVALRFARMKGAGELKPPPPPPRMVEP